MENQEQGLPVQVVESEVPGIALNPEVVHCSEDSEAVDTVLKNLDVAGTRSIVGGEESVDDTVLVAEPADSIPHTRSPEVPNATSDVQLSTYDTTVTVDDGSVLPPAEGPGAESTDESILLGSSEVGMPGTEDIPLGDDTQGPDSEDMLQGKDATPNKISSTEQGDMTTTELANEETTNQATKESEMRRSARARKPRELSPPCSKPPVRVARKGAREGEQATLEADKLGGRSRRLSGASNPTAGTPMSPLIAAAANSKKPTPTKSLPSKMERMQFRTTLVLKPETPQALEKKTLQTYFRQQNSTTELKVAYNCQKCSFRTSRMENLVRHNKAECAFVKDFFSWDANTFSEVAKKKAVFPSDVDMDTTLSITATPMAMPKRKSLPRHRLESLTKASKVDTAEKRKTTTPIKKTTGWADEESSDTDNEPPPPAEGVTCNLEFSEDDVVWVEWKRLHWPALVLKIYPNTRKAKVFLIDSISSKETVMINVKKIFNFNSAERNKRFLNEGRVGRNSGALVKAAQKAEEFLRKRCLGIHINAKQFFCDGQVQFVEDFSEASSESYLGSELWSCSPASCEGDADRENAEASKERRKQRNEKLVECIKAGKVDNHLLGILNGSIPSQRHEKFHSDAQCERLKLKQLSWFGPIDDPNQQEEIYEHCFELLKGNSNEDDTFDIASYVIEVWCPEAVMKALCHTRRVDMARAEEILTRAVVLSKAEHEVAHRDMLATSPTPEERKEHEERIRSNFRDMGIEDEILAALNF